jgi:hypothetical protein
MFAWLPVYSLNMMAQMSACIFLLLVSYYVLCKMLFGERLDKTVFVTMALFCLCFRDRFVVFYGNGMSYAQSLGFLSLSVLSIRHAASSRLLKRSALVVLSLVFLLLSVWVSFNIVILLFFVLGYMVLQSGPSWGFRALAIQSVVVAMALLAYMLWIGMGGGAYKYSFDLSYVTVQSGVALARSAYGYFLDDALRQIVVFAGLGCALFACRRQGKAIAVQMLFLVCFFLVEALVACSNSWVAKNGFPPRYLTVSMTLLIFFSFYHAGLLFARFSDGQLRAMAIAVVVLFLNVPSYSSALKSMIATDEAKANEVVALDCNLLAGQYWMAWKTAFVANVLRQHLDLPGLTLGLSNRSSVVVEYAADHENAENFIVCVQDDADLGGAGYFLDIFHVKAHVLMKLKTMMSLAVEQLADSRFVVDEQKYFQAMQHKVASAK